MKKTLSVLIICLLSGNYIFAKMVKFAVDMRFETVSPNGIHIVGDFQTLAGFAGGDWVSNTTTLTQEIQDTNIYSIVVNIPAFAKYEYKFVNGDQFYEAEFVPVPSRVGYSFNDNRWLYVDSIQNDTSFAGNIVFASNAPLGLTLIRFLTDLQYEPSVSTDGVHVSADFQGYNPATNRLYSFIPGVYELILYTTSGDHFYRFYNGNNSVNSETVPLACDSNAYRYISLNSDSVLSTVCFNGCEACSPTFADINQNAGVLVFPVPSNDYVQIQLPNQNKNYCISIFNDEGKLLHRELNINNNFTVNKAETGNGIFFIRVSNSEGFSYTTRIIFE